MKNVRDENGPIAEKSLQPDLEEGERYERSQLFGMPDKR